MGRGQVAPPPQGGILIDEQARTREIQLDAATFCWMPCTSAEFSQRISFRGSPSMMELIPGRGADSANVELFIDLRKRLLMIQDNQPHQNPSFRKVKYVPLESVSGFSLKMDEEQPPVQE